MNSPHRILIIDDNRAIHEDFRKIFCPERPVLSAFDEAAFFGGPPTTVSRMPNFELEFASQGLDGCALLERLVAAGRAPVVAFVDVRMPPGIDGIETSERLWKIFPELQIVICTAYSDYSWEEMIDRLPQRDRLLILKKPFAAIEALQLASALREKSLLTQKARHHLTETERITEERTRELRAANERVVVEMNQRMEAERLLLRSQRLESIGTLATGIAHDLNNMLSPISLAAELLSGDWPEATREELISTIAKSADRAAGIVRQVLTFARGAGGERAPLRMLDLVREVQNLIRDSFPRNIQIERNVPSDVWLVDGDATQLNQILMNLCVNARDAMPYGGTLSVAVGNYECDAGCRVTALGGRPGRYVSLRVSDTGTGIPTAVIDKIFDPFFTTKELGKGTGLGLSTVVGIVKNHEGFIDVQSRPGEGTTFEIFLPALTDVTPLQMVTEQRAAADGEGQLILLVDDEEEILLLLETVLTSHGYRVITASDGAEALTTFFEFKTQIDTVVTDMMMPLMDGIALCRALRGISPRVNIIATTGSIEEAHALELQALNIRNILAKPFQTSALLKLIQDTLAPHESSGPLPALQAA